MSQKQNDANSSYMDGIRVKISEKYMPPPKVSVAMTYAQRLTLNRQLHVNLPAYNFDTDSCVCEKMKEWRKARQAMTLERKSKLDKIKKEELQRLQALELKQNEEQAIKESKELQDCGNDQLSTMLIPTQANILTPIPLAPQKFVQNKEDMSPINISDFESDTSSPFDNLELKTINDLEELKLVLQNDEKSKHQLQNNQTYAPSHNSFYNYMPASSNQGLCADSMPYVTTSTTATNGYTPYYTQTGSSIGGYPFASYNSPPKEYVNKFDTLSMVVPTTLPTVGSNGATSDNNVYNCVPNIIKALQNQLNLNVQETTSNVDNAVALQVSPSQIQKSKDLRSINGSDRLENPYNSLSKQSQDVCTSIACMGFPLDRVARACKLLGDDDKKIIEYLLSMSQLMDLGFNEEHVASALSKSDNERDKALELLIS